MPGQSLSFDAFVLAKRPPTEAFQPLTVFSVEHGPLRVLQRQAKKSAGTIAPLDLFDEVALTVESSNQGQTWFLKEARILTRHHTIGRNYSALLHASAIANLVARNPVPEESRASVATLLRQAFQAFARSTRPDIVRLKSVYLFARDEGHPVSQQWFPTLPSEDRANLAKLLNQPLAVQDAPAEVVERLTSRLEEYLRGHTEIVFD